MAEKTQETKEAEVKPPMAAEFVGDVKSGSFRNLQYLAPESESQKNIETNVPWWRRFASARYPQPAKTEEVVEALSRQSSQGLTPRGNPDLPPKSSSGRVGLPTVTLMGLNEPPKDKATTEEGGDVTQTTETMPQTSPRITRMSLTDKKSETEEVGHASVTDAAKQTDEGKTEATETLPLESQTKKEETEPLTAEGVKNEPVEVVEHVEGHSAGVAETEKEETVKSEETPVEKKAEAPTLAKTRIEGVGGSTKETSTRDKVSKLKTSQSVVKPTTSQPTFFSRLFSFGTAKSPSDVKESIRKQEEARVQVVKETQEIIPAEEPKGAESASAKDAAEVKSPLEPEHTTEPESGVVAEQVVPKAPIKTDLISSDLAQTELEELKTLFISEMKLKGIDVEGKYTKLSSDFDSPLLFLLDLHTFAEMEHSTVKMEQLLAERFGAEHSLVSEFTEAATREKVETEGKTKAEGTTTGISESSLDTARNGSGETPKEPKPAESSSDAQAETTAAEKGEVKSPPEKATAPGQTEQEPPSIPPLRDETKNIDQKGCAFCICLFPKAE